MTRTVATAAAICLAASAALAQQTAVRAEVDRRRISLDDTIELRIVVSGPNRAMTPRMPALAGLVVTGPFRTSSTQISGRQVSTQTIFKYLLSPRREGAFTIPAVTVPVGRRLFRTRPITITVSRSLEPKALRVESSLSHKKLYVGQHFDLVFQAKIAAHLIRARRIALSSLTVPWLEEIPGLRVWDPQNLAEKWNTGEIRGRDSYEVVRGINGKIDAVVVRSVEQVDGVTHLVQTLRRRGEFLTPGTRRIAGAFARAQVYRRARSAFDEPFFGGSFFGGRRPNPARNVSATAPDWTVEVLPLPAKGRPADFSGGVGRYQLHAKVEPVQVTLGEAVTLTATVQTDGRIDTVGAPRLPPTAGLSIHEVDSATRTFIRNDALIGEKTFSWPIYPNEVAVTEIPALTFSYFDPEAEAYRTLRAGPFPIHVQAPAGAGQGARVITSALLRRLRGKEVLLRGEDIEDIVTQVDRLVDHGAYLHARPLGLALLLGSPALFAMVAILGLRRRRLRADPALARRRAAGGVARRALAASGSGATHVELARVLVEFLAARAGRAAGEITAGEARGIAAANGASDPTADEAFAVLSACEESRFAGGTGEAHEAAGAKLIERVRRLITTLEREGV